MGLRPFVLRKAATIGLFCLASSSVAQEWKFLPTASDYLIMQDQQNKMCVASLSLESRGGRTASLAYYWDDAGKRENYGFGITQEGAQRLSKDQMSASFGQAPSIVGEVAFMTDGSFSFPKMSKKEWAQFRNDMRDKEFLEIRFEQLDDEIMIDLDGFRLALEAIRECAESL